MSADDHEAFECDSSAQVMCMAGNDNQISRYGRNLQLLSLIEYRLSEKEVKICCGCADAPNFECDLALLKLAFLYKMFTCDQDVQSREISSATSSLYYIAS